MMDKTNIEYQKLFVSIYQGCDVILSHARLLNFPFLSLRLEMTTKKFEKEKKVISIYSPGMVGGQKYQKKQNFSCKPCHCFGD